MFHSCKLVHADLSEYNILYHEGDLFIIDVSQSVEHDHPSAFDFLRKDIQNVDDFFAKLGTKTLGLRRTFEFITAETTDEDEQEKLHALIEYSAQEDDDIPEALEANETGGDQKVSPADRASVEDSVFMRAYIPRTLDQVYDPERDVDVLNRGDGDALIYKNTIGVVPSRPTASEKPEEKKSVRFEQGSESGEEDESQSESGSGEFTERAPRGHRHEDREVKKERKKAVKEEAREKRKQKMPKAEKKKKIKASKGH